MVKYKTDDYVIGFLGYWVIGLIVGSICMLIDLLKPELFKFFLYCVGIFFVIVLLIFLIISCKYFGRIIKIKVLGRIDPTFNDEEK